MEIGIIVIIALVFFGPKQLPKLGRAIGETIKEFRGVRKQIDDAVDDVDNSNA